MRKNDMKLAAKAVLVTTAALYGLVLAGCNGTVPAQTQTTEIADTCAAIDAANLVIQNDKSASATLKADATAVVDTVASTCANPNATYSSAEVGVLTSALTKLQTAQ